MNKSQLKYLIDFGMGVSFLLCFITGLMKWPTKTVGRMEPGFLVNFLHDYAGILLGLFVFIHLIINWSWVIHMTKKIFSRN